MKYFLIYNSDFFDIEKKDFLWTLFSNLGLVKIHWLPSSLLSLDHPSILTNFYYIYIFMKALYNELDYYLNSTEIFVYECYFC